MHHIEVRRDTMGELPSRRDTYWLLTRIGIILLINCFLLYYLYQRQYNLIIYTSVPPFKESVLVANNSGVKNGAQLAGMLGNSTISGIMKEVSNHSCYRQIQFFARSQTPMTPTDHECPGVQCGIRFVTDQSMESFKKSDAVILFHRTSLNWKFLHEQRPPGQKWVFYTMESPRNTHGPAYPPKPYTHISYNYTMSYRGTSTFPVRFYGYYDPSDPEIKDSQPINWAARRPKMVAWLVSNCNIESWRRYAFVKTLSKYIHIDVYGGCGTMKCGNSNNCMETLKQYKFYLALENSECRDYISEKFYKNSLNNGLIPIVYGTFKEDYKKVAPPHSFIHLHDFKSLQETADFLKKVAENETLYNSFLQWKLHGSIKFDKTGEYLNGPYLCPLVDRIIQDEAKEATGITGPSIIRDLDTWWRGSCQSRPGFPRDF